MSAAEEDRRKKKKEKKDKKKTKISSQPDDDTNTIIASNRIQNAGPESTNKRKRSHRADGEDVPKKSKKSKKSRRSAELDEATETAATVADATISQPRKREVSSHSHEGTSLEGGKKKDKKRSKKPTEICDATAIPAVVNKREGSQSGGEDSQKKKKKSKYSRKRSGTSTKSYDTISGTSVTMDSTPEAAAHMRSFSNAQDENTETPTSSKEVAPTFAQGKLQSTKAFEGRNGNSVNHDHPSNKHHEKRNNVPFSRIPTDIKVDERFASNHYQPYDFAHHSYNDLSVTKGKGFTKEKNKKKRGQSFRGGKIDIAVGRSIKFDD